MAKDLSPEVAKKAILSMGRIAIRLDIAVDNVVYELIQLLDAGSHSVCDWAMVALRDVLRRHRDVASTVIPELQKSMKTVSSAEGKSALVWILGEYGDEIQESPYILEDFIAGWDEENAPVRLQLLTTAVKLFFRRTSEMKENLLAALNKGVADAAHPDVHDRALFYLRLIAHGINHARHVFSEPQVPIVVFEDEARPEVKDRIFEEFNTLSVVFDEPSDRFIKKAADFVEAALTSSSSTEPAKTNQPQQQAAPIQQEMPPSGNLVDFSSPEPTTPTPQQAQQPPKSEGVTLKPNPQLSPKAFEATWKQLPAGFVSKSKLRSINLRPRSDNFSLPTL